MFKKIWNRILRTLGMSIDTPDKMDLGILLLILMFTFIGVYATIKTVVGWF